MTKQEVFQNWVPIHHSLVNLADTGMKNNEVLEACLTGPLLVAGWILRRYWCHLPQHGFAGYFLLEVNRE